MAFEPSLQQAELLEIFSKYEQFTVQTLEAKHGKTAQYYKFKINRLLLNAHYEHPYQ